MGMASAPQCEAAQLSFLRSVASASLTPRVCRLELPKLNAGGRRGGAAALRVGAAAGTLERVDLTEFVKKAMPGGIAAQELLGTGRRKRAVARVCLLEGTGQYVINCRSAQEYLQGNPAWIRDVKVPLLSLGYEGKYDVIVKAEGGGLSGQAQAIRLGVARALLKVNADNRPPLRKLGFLTRDSRRVERKKVGKHKARKSHQFSKR